ncbi:MarR family winged helix-turn-helix transcriptional regulator [Spirosoma utsteinense]|uniref:DNA-binding MarR family transcriptional regulator n=1 Tax=Spirosoma utsteinense TaxID=2585773 RepID=A0ABR6WDM4_9BACT|nr:MarR family winged helix-turn-helix transcriptional regulator [Spirosoma utsteinense]MBC3788677.1 DNA-binding MarR family transcriptional regulator [Spirosoma utsteinense]MBC3794631.1 DNA-binding MarR family transcriptional regulator [Spirosoma utsteinense]
MTNSPIFAYAEPEENNGYLLWQVSMRWQLLMNQRLRDVGITLTQFSLLAGLYWLDRRGEVVTQQRLADYANTDKMMTSKVVQTLEGKGLLSRMDNPEDGRAKQLRLTPAGETVLGQANTLVEQVDAAVFQAIQSEANVFNRLMQQLMANMPK